MTWRREELLDDVPEVLNIEGFREMASEAGFATALHILRLTQTRERDQWDGRAKPGANLTRREIR
jgi:hypothetical protein